MLDLGTSFVASVSRDPHGVAIVDGELLVDDFAPVRVDRVEVAVTARAAARDLAGRAGL